MQDREGEPLRGRDLREQKRERILATAARLFYEGGYRATSMESIAEELSVTKPFLYYHFENKHEILEEVARRVIALGRLVRAGADPEHVVEAFTEAICGYARMARANRELFVVLFREVSNLSRATQALLQEEQRAHVARLGELLALGTARGAFCAPSPHTTAAAILTFLTFGEVFRVSLPAPDEAPDDYVVELALRMAGNRRCEG